MPDQPDLYQALMQRYSLRAFDSRKLDDETLNQIEQFILNTEPLFKENRMGISLIHQMTSKERSSALGLVNPHIHPPHILVTWMNGGKSPYTDLGYRMEQVTVYLHRMGIGSCFIGTLGREEAINQQYNLPPHAVTGALLAIGKSANPNTGNKPKKRMELEKLVFSNDFSTPLTPPNGLSSILEAARVSPSATNAQPWRLLWKKPDLYLFVTPKKLANLLSADFKKYCLYDGGICMANISMALKAYHLPAKWEVLDSSSPTVPQHPQEFIPLGKIRIDL